MDAWAIGLGIAAVLATLAVGFMGMRKARETRIVNASRTTVDLSTKTLEAPRTVVNAPTYVHAPVTISQPAPRLPPDPHVPEGSGEEAPGDVGDSVIEIDEECEVDAGSFERIEFEAESGDTVEGLIESDGAISVYLVPRRRLPAFMDGDLEGVLECGEDATTIHVNRRIRKGGIWYLVLDAHGKKNARTVSVSLTVGP